MEAKHQDPMEPFTRDDGTPIVKNQAVIEYTDAGYGFLYLLLALFASWKIKKKCDDNYDIRYIWPFLAFVSDYWWQE